jgi:hypothetical protein
MPVFDPLTPPVAEPPGAISHKGEGIRTHFQTKKCVLWDGEQLCFRKIFPVLTPWLENFTWTPLGALYGVYPQWTDAVLSSHDLPTLFWLIPMVYTPWKPWSCRSTPKTPLLTIRMLPTTMGLPCDQGWGHFLHMPPKGDIITPSTI